MHSAPSRRGAARGRGPAPAIAAVCAALAGCGGGSAQETAAATDAPTTLAVSVVGGGSVSVAGGGGGAATITGAGAFALAAESTVTLVAAPAAGWRFDGWSGECSGPATACGLRAGAFDASVSVVAVFRLLDYTLTVSSPGGGAVTVTTGAGPATVVPAGERRGFAVTAESAVTLVAAPAAGWRFDGWSGECAVSGERCDLSGERIVSDAAVEASFAPVAYTLRAAASTGGSMVVTVGVGSAGTVASGGELSFAVTVEDSVTLQATAVAHYRFEGWTGPCSGLAVASCKLAAGSLVSGASVAAVFRPTIYTLAVSAAGNGTVATALGGRPAGTVEAGGELGFEVTVESSATLAAVAAAHYRFAGWSGECAGASGALCELPAGALAGGGSANAAFSPATYILSAAAAGSGTVAVALGGRPAGTVEAGGELGFEVTVESAATLAAVAAAHYRFAGWSGECAGTSGALCDLPAGALAGGGFAAAMFAPVTYTLTVSAASGGTVAVALGGRPAGTVADGGELGFEVTVESAATLAATPADSYRFAGWSGKCAGASGALCELPAGAFVADAFATATFSPATHILTVSTAGSGTVAVALDGRLAGTVAAGGEFGFEVTVESAATLAATPANSYRFAGWIGKCAGASGALCELPAGSLVADAFAIAAFAATTRTLTVVAGPNGAVTVAIDASPAATVDAGTAREFVVTVESAATLTAVAAAGWRLERWDGECAGASGLACTLAGDALAGGAFAGAVFAPATYILAVSASAGGSVAVSIDGEDAGTVAANSTRSFAVTAADSAALSAEPAAGWRLERWDGECAGASGLACALTGGALAGGALAGGAFAGAVFAPVAYTLAVSASAGGSVAVSIDGEDAGTVAANSTRSFAVTVEDSAALSAEPAAGWRLERWDGECAGASGLACALTGGALAGGALAGGAFAGAVFAPVAYTLAVSASAGGSVAVSIDGEDAGTVAANSTRSFAVTVEDSAALSAEPAAGWRLERWDGECAGASGLACALSGGALTGDAFAGAVFAPVTYTLTVSASAGGSVAVSIDGGLTETVPAGFRRHFTVTIQSSARLEATPDEFRRFAGWIGECARVERAVCALAPGAFSAHTDVLASFGPAGYLLDVSASAGGSVAVSIDGEDAGTVAANSTRSFAVTAAEMVTMEAVAADQHRFVGWSGVCPGFAAVCELSPGSILADSFAAAAFANPFDWTGPGSVSAAGATLTAVAHAAGAFIGWRSGPCEGSSTPVCDVAGAGVVPAVAAFHPFVVDGIKSLSFGLGYRSGAASHFRVSIGSSGGGYVPALDGLDPAESAVHLSAPVHLLAWGVDSYLTEACDADGACQAARGGERTLARADSIAATGYFKAPDASAGDWFGLPVALSGDGRTLAVGAQGEDSSATGVLSSDRPGWESALAGGGGENSGAVYVHRRADSGRWTLDAVAKAPRPGVDDWFGQALALSGDGRTLAVGAEGEDSSATGVAHPSDTRWDAALASDGAEDSGAVYIHRRADSGRWALAALVKAPWVDVHDWFGHAVALSADGRTLAVGAPLEDSSATGVAHPSDARWDAALANGGAPNSGGVYAYLQDSSGRWTAKAFVKAPATGIRDRFGSAVALSADGRSLAVGAPLEDSSATGVFSSDRPGWESALASDGTEDSGAVYVHRRADSGGWALEAFVKAPAGGAGDSFGSAVALSADGRSLAVGAPREDSSATGVAHPSDARWDAALASGDAKNSGAAYVHRRADPGGWALEALVKAPVASAGDRFGSRVALSGDGRTLAANERLESSSAAGVFAPGGPGYRDAVGDGSTVSSGAAHVYRRSSAGRWVAGNFVKAPRPGLVDSFGSSIALSADGRTLAVGAALEDGGAQPRPLSGRAGAAADAGAAIDSGAAYLY